MLIDWKEYKTLAELKAAYESGELDKEQSPLVWDNGWAYVTAAYGTEGDWDEVFRSETLISDLLDFWVFPGKSPSKGEGQDETY